MAKAEYELNEFVLKVRRCVVVISLVFFLLWGEGEQWRKRRSFCDCLFRRGIQSKAIRRTLNSKLNTWLSMSSKQTNLLVLFEKDRKKREKGLLGFFKVVVVVDGLYIRERKKEERGKKKIWRWDYIDYFFSWKNSLFLSASEIYILLLIPSFPTPVKMRHLCCEGLKGWLKRYFTHKIFSSCISDAV